MTETQARIIEMLNEGMSYSTIQEELSVSSKTISATRKAFLESENSSKDGLSSTFLDQNPDPPPQPVQWENNNTMREINNNFKTQKPKQIMTNYNENFDNEEYDDNEPVSKLSLDKYRLQLEHEREMAKLEALSVKEEREQCHKDEELQLKRAELALIQQKKNEEMRSLLFRLKKLTDQCEDGEYDYEEVESMNDEAEKLLSDIEKYCFVNELTFEGTESQKMLSMILTTFSEFLESTDDDESNDLEFEESLEEMISKTNFRKF